MDQKNPIVGIGASAGGLEAITDFFTSMPANTGLSFVVIQHLSPDFKSMMDELLAKHTDMPIEVIGGDTVVKPNTIYLISSRSNIFIEQGIIKQIDRKPNSVVNLPIDMFFHSLGKDMKEKSIGIILSGTGTDGSRGIRSIKEEGGLVFVQDPKSAQFDGMPNTAITTGVADAVLSPSDIAEKILSIVHRSRNGQNMLLDIESDHDLNIFNNILTLIEKETGVDFREYRKSTLVRRLEKRMYLNHALQLKDYHKFMLQHPEEVNALYREFLIGVTRFFRDPDAFEIIEKKVVPEIIKSKNSHQQLRIWCVGCSSGEEAYSIGILLAEYISRSQSGHTFKIFATDIDKSAIKSASAGLYYENVASDMPSHILEKYFVKVGNSYRIVKSIRDNMVFTAHDALRDPPFINMDLIVCRNMMIYINSSIQRNLLINFQFSLNLNGFLFLGPSESISPVKKAFRAVDTRWNIFRNISTAKPVPISRERTVGLSGRFESKLKSQEGKDNQGYNVTAKYEDFIAREISEQYGPRSLFVDEKFNIHYINGDFKDILLFPRAFAEMNLLLMIDANDELLFRNGVRKALSQSQSSLYKSVHLQRDKRTLEADIRFSRFTSRSIEEPLVWVEFDIKNDDIQKAAKSKDDIIGFDTYKSEQLQTLELELRQIKKEKQYLVEQLETANEELQSSNEELLAANEELQSTNEELQSVNEELYTVNTELQSKINELIISNNDITNLLSSTNIGTIFLDLDLRIRKFTPALREQFDLQETDLGRPIFNFTNSFTEDIYDEIKEVLETREQIEREIQDKNGNYFLMRLLPYWINDDELDGVVISFVNVNEITVARKVMNENAKKFEALFKHTNNIIFTLDKEGIVTSVNRDSVAGISADQLIGNRFDTPQHGNTDDRIKALAKARQTKQSVNYESFIEDEQGNSKWYEVFVIPIIHENEIQFFIVVAQDVSTHKLIAGNLMNLSKDLEKELSVRNSELESANNDLREVNAYLDSFVHGAAHDLRAPIAQMKGMIDLLPKIKSEAQVEKILSQFRQGVEQMDSTLNGLIELIEFQKNTAAMISEVDLVGVFNEVQKQLKEEIESAGVEIITDFHPPAKINFIKAYVKSIFFNLLSNAIKYRAYDRPQKILISIRQENKYQVIQVQDTGIGMDLNKYGHFLFKPFKRLTVERKGIGIGLSIINSAVSKAGGRIEVQSKLGEGSVFKVFLPPMSSSGSQENLVKENGSQKHY